MSQVNVTTFCLPLGPPHHRLAKREKRGPLQEAFCQGHGCLLLGPHLVILMLIISFFNLKFIELHFEESSSVSCQTFVALSPQEKSKQDILC